MFRKLCKGEHWLTPLNAWLNTLSDITLTQNGLMSPARPDSLIKSTGYYRHLIKAVEKIKCGVSEIFCAIFTHPRPTGTIFLFIVKYPHCSHLIYHFTMRSAVFQNCLSLNFLENFKMHFLTIPLVKGTSWYWSFCYLNSNFFSPQAKLSTRIFSILCWFERLKVFFMQRFSLLSSAVFVVVLDLFSVRRGCNI